jgi:hypothetical protein
MKTWVYPDHCTIHNMKYYAFDEPIEGMATNKDAVLCCQTTVMSERDAILYWRRKLSVWVESNQDVLEDFIVVNHAYPIKPLILDVDRKDG